MGTISILSDIKNLARLRLDFNSFTKSNGTWLDKLDWFIKDIAKSVKYYCIDFTVKFGYVDIVDSKLI